MIPCDREYGTTCSVFCSFGYTLEGPSKQSCVLLEGSTTEVEWTEPPICNGKIYACMMEKAIGIATFWHHSVIYVHMFQGRILVNRTHA